MGAAKNSGGILAAIGRVGWLNLRVWAPALADRECQLRLIRYRTSEGRVGLRWTIGLPRQCWRCGKTEALDRCEFDRDVRSFDAPLPKLIGGVGFAGLFLVPAIVFGWGWAFNAALLALVLAMALLWLKSWREQVRLTMWSCRQHAADALPPALVIHDEELYVHVATVELAEAAQSELQAARRRDRRYASEDAPAKPRRPETPVASRPEQPATARFTPPPRPELPPIKLADEDDIFGPDPAQS